MTKYAVHEFMGENKNKLFIIEAFAEFGIDKDIVTIGGKGVAPIWLCRVNQGVTSNSWGQIGLLKHEVDATFDYRIW